MVEVAETSHFLGYAGPVGGAPVHTLGVTAVVVSGATKKKQQLTEGSRQGRRRDSVKLKCDLLWENVR